MSNGAALLWRIWRGGDNTVRRLMVEQPLRAAAVTTVIGLVWLLIFGVAWIFLEFMSQSRYASLKGPLVKSLLTLFFFALFFLVTISNALVVWGNLFRTRGALYQAQLPVSNRSLFWGATVEGGLWASWAVLVLAVPLVAALSRESHQLLYFLPTAMLVLLSFLLCCMAGGALGAIILARAIPILRKGMRAFIVTVLILLALGIITVVNSLDQSGGMGTDFLRRVMGRISFVENPYLPPLWAQRALAAAARSDWSQWTYFVSLMLLSASALAIAGEWLAARRLRIDMDLLCGRGDSHRAGRSKDWRPLRFLPHDLGVLVAKDIRLFVRDPAQILQFAMFFGMLGFYILLLPRIGQAFLEWDWWRKAVSLLNLTAVSMALATFTGRFVFPLLSLEGRRLWVLILAPWPAHRIVTAKFAFALIVGVPVSVVLVTLSGILLQLTPQVICYQALVTICMGLGLSAGALGLGARLADYNEENPAKLVSGYGGTVNLLASLVYAGLLLTGAAFPLLAPDSALGWIGGLAWTLGITAVWTFIGMRVAWRWFGHEEVG